MRSVRITLGLVVAACALSVAVAPAFAEPMFFGEFTASRVVPITEAEPGITKGRGEVEALRLGPYNIVCSKLLKTAGKVTSTRNPTFYTEMTFQGCSAVTFSEGAPGQPVEELRAIKFGGPLDFEYQPNGSVYGGGSNSESEVHLIKPTNASFKVKGSTCLIEVPSQWLPLKAEKNKEIEYSFASYSPETETVAGKKALFPTGEREKLFIDNEFKKIKTIVHPNARCHGKGESEGEWSEEGKTLKFENGIFSGELEEELVQGNLGFEA